MIKILHIQLLPILSGVQKVSLEILKNLPEDKFERWILCAEIDDLDEPNLISECKRENIKVKTIENLIQPINKADFRVLKDIYSFIKREKFDIVHTNSSKTGFLGRIAARFAGTKNIIHTIHGIAFHKFESPLRRFTYFFADLFASLFSNYLISVNRYYLKFFPFISKNRKTTIYNSIDYSKIEQKKEYNTDQQKPIKLIFIGRLDFQKDPKTFIESLKILKNKNVDFKADIYGEGEFSEEISNLINIYNLDSFVELKGWESNLGKLIKNYDLLCCTSIYEAFGLIFLESGYCGIPAVATNAEGIPEVVVENETGFLVNPRSPKLFAEKIIKFSENRNLLFKMGKNAQSKVLTEFSHKNFLKRYEKLYLNLEAN